MVGTLVYDSESVAKVSFSACVVRVAVGEKEPERSNGTRLVSDCTRLDLEEYKSSVAIRPFPLRVKGKQTGGGGGGGAGGGIAGKNELAV